MIIVNRDLKKSKYPWLDNDIEKGTVVYRYYGCTYGCISPNGIAVSMEENEPPFLEIPSDSFITAIDKKEP